MDKTEYQKLKDIVEGISADYNKAMTGNRAAATRVRKAMQDVKATAQNIRTGILSDVKKEG
jgi:ribosome maturation protein Sdo1